MIEKEYRDFLIGKLDSEDYYVMTTVLADGKGEVNCIVPSNSSWQDFIDYWVQSGTGLSTEEFDAYNKLSKEEKEQIAKLAKLNNLKRQVEALEKEIK